MSEMNFPSHKCGLYLTHNEHRDYYENLADWLKQSPQQKISWPDTGAKQRAIETDECWMLQWCPETPVGFNLIAAPTLEECLAFAATFE